MTRDQRWAPRRRVLLAFIANLIGVGGDPGLHMHAFRRKDSGCMYFVGIRGMR